MHRGYDEITFIPARMTVFVSDNTHYTWKEIWYTSKDCNVGYYYTC